MTEPNTAPQEEIIEEGWKYLVNSPKWHYFRDGRSLCRRWGTLSNADLQQGNDNSIDNCAMCKKKLAVEESRRIKALNAWHDEINP